MDETPTYIVLSASTFFCPKKSNVVPLISGTTLDFFGQKNVDADSTGANKCRFTVVLCCNYAGDFTKTRVIFKGLKKVPKVKVPKDIVVRVSDGGSMKETLMLDWMQTVFSSRGRSTEKSLLLMDAHTSHITPILYGKPWKNLILKCSLYQQKLRRICNHSMWESMLPSRVP